MILVFGDTDGQFPAIREVYSVWPVTVIILLSVLIVGAFYLGHRAGRNKAGLIEAWSRVEILTALGVAVMIATFIVTVLNTEVRRWLSLP